MDYEPQNSAKQTWKKTPTGSEDNLQNELGSEKVKDKPFSFSIMEQNHFRSMQLALSGD